MNIGELLNTKKCACGKVHGCEIKDVVIGKGAIRKIGELSKNYKNIVLAADTNTYAVCGESVKKQLDGKSVDVLIYESEGFLVPNEEAVGLLAGKVGKDTELIVGVGSGVIQDLCKYVSFEKKIPYYIVATAPSMDGYASKGAAMIFNDMKITCDAHVPEVIIGDTEILKDAPIDMIKSGYGDILGKFSCLNDWKLSHAVNGEYICDYVYDLTYEMLERTKGLGTRLLARDEAAVEELMNALIGVGIAMAYVGNSRPASGSEHHLSHFFEIVGLLNNEPYFMHGTDVAFSAVYTQKLRERLLEIGMPEKRKLPDKESREAEIRRIYTTAADGIIELQSRVGRYDEDKSDVYAQKWEEIKDILRQTPSSEEMTKYLESVGLDIRDYEKLYGADKIKDAMLYAKDLKDRYTVLWLYYCLFA